MTLTQQRHHPLVNRLWRNDEPAIVFKFGGTDMNIAIDKVQAHDETTQDSGSERSATLNLSAMENETDEFGRKLLQHQRDMQLLNDAIRPGQQAFRKARPRPRLTEWPVNRDAQSTLHAGQDHERTGSAGSSGSDPPLNVPTQWGRKAKRRTDWLHKLQEPSNTDEGVLQAPDEVQARIADEDAIIPHKTAYTGDQGWKAVLESVETTPPSMQRQRAETTPSSLRHMNTTIKDALASDDQDFTAASLLASTPAVNRRNRRVDELTRREIDNIEKRGITKRTLDQILDRNQIESRPMSAPPAESGSNNRRRRSLIANKENLAPHRNVNAAPKVSKWAASAVPAATTDNQNRPTHARTDSYNLLKQLARVSSMSPSPRREKSEHGVPLKPSGNDRIVESVTGDGQIINGNDSPPTVPRSTIDERDQHVYPTPEPDIGEANARGQNEAGERAAIDATPELLDPPRASKMPAVAGAWVNTPASRAEVESVVVPAKIESSETPPRRVHSEPVQAKSALADILEDMRSRADGQYGETTIQSLEDIVNPDLDLTDPTLNIHNREMGPAIITANESGETLTQTEKDRREERLAIEAMDKHLRAVRTSIKDANRGLRRVENRIETAHTDSPSIMTRSQMIQPGIVPRAGPKVCEHCGGPYYSSVWYGLWVEFRDCFYTFNPASSWNISFTMLGILFFSFITWLIIEYTLCEYYCHPLYAKSMIGYGIDPDAPEFPLVIPTLALRPFKFIWKPVLEGLAWCSGVLYNMWFGEPVASTSRTSRRLRYVDEMASASSGIRYEQWKDAAATVTSRVAGSVKDAIDDVGRMWDDEVLS